MLDTIPVTIAGDNLSQPDSEVRVQTTVTSPVVILEQISSRDADDLDPDQHEHFHEDPVLTQKSRAPGASQSEFCHKASAEMQKSLAEAPNGQKGSSELSKVLESEEISPDKEDSITKDIVKNGHTAYKSCSTGYESAEIHKLANILIENSNSDLFKGSLPVNGSLVKETPAQEIRVYKRRWYILIVFSIYSFTQACVWNTFGPISSTSEEAFGWSDGDIALLNNWGPISYIITGIFFCWMLDVKGLRLATLFSALLTLVGAGLRCITTDTPAVTWLVNVGHMLNGMGGPVAMGAPPIVSAVWFPLHERATATAIGTAFNYLGVAVGFILGPSLVKSYHLMSGNVSELPLESSIPSYHMSVNSTDPSNNRPMSTPASLDVPDIGRERHAIQFYMFISLGWCAALLVLILVYFPKKPPLPPCASAAVEREDFVAGFKYLMKRKQFWIVAILYGVSLGVLNCWIGMLNVNLSSHGIGEEEAGWIGFYSTVAGCAMCLLVARFADTFARIMKQFIIGLYLASTIFFLVFALALIEVVPPSTALFYATIIGGSTALNSAIPLIYELVCELAYPTGEGTTNVVLTTIGNFGGLVFLFIVMIPNIGSMWMNWALVGLIGICVPLWFFLKESYNRLEVDEANPSNNFSNVELGSVPVPPQPLKHTD